MNREMRGKGAMKKTAFFSAFIFAFAALMTVARADGMVTKAPPAATATTANTPASCTNFWDFISTNCPLTWYGITVYGTIDTGVGWQSNSAPLNDFSSFGVNYLIQKNSNRSLWLASPNGLSQSNIGIKGSEPLGSGWSFIFDLQADFDPYSLELANGPYSVAQNAGVPLPDQNSYGDSSRGGQFYNGTGYAGVSSSTYGTITFFRQNALTLDGIAAYDPMATSYAFSPIGYSGTTCGVGNTEDCRFTTSAKYRVNIGQFRLAALWQFGGYDQNNPSNGAYQLQAGGDIKNLAGGTLSLDAIGSYVRDAVSVGLSGNPTVNGVPVSPFLPQVLTATISDDSSVMLLGKYANGPVKLYAGYEWIQYAPPSGTPTPFTDIGGDFITALNTTAFDFHDKILQVFWTGAAYAVTKNVNVVGAYYHYDQNSFGGGASSGCTTIAFSSCSGTFDAVSAMVDWQFEAKYDAYAGVMYSQVNDGLANGYLKTNNIDPTVGLRFRF
jgi:predicted porin